MSSLDSSMQNLSDVTQPLTAKPTDNELCKELNATKNHSDSSDDTHKNLSELIYNYINFCSHSYFFLFTSFIIHTYGLYNTSTIFNVGMYAFYSSNTYTTYTCTL